MKHTVTILGLLFAVSISCNSVRAEKIKNLKDIGEIDIGTLGNAIGGTGTVLYVLDTFVDISPKWQKVTRGVGIGSTIAGIVSSDLLRPAFGGEIPPTSSDPVRQIKGTKEFEQLKKTFGEQKATEFLMDVLAGWAPEKLVEKYIADPKDKELLLAALKTDRKRLTVVAARAFATAEDQQAFLNGTLNVRLLYHWISARTAEADVKTKVTKLLDTQLASLDAHTPAAATGAGKPARAHK